MTAQPIYSERILSKLLALIIGAVALWMAFALGFQILGGSAEIDSDPTLLLATLLVLFTPIMANFLRLTILITPENLKVSFGVVSRQIPLENIESCYLDQTSAVYYGGFGIRIARIHGKWRLVYNVIASPRVVLVLKSGGIREFVFSTENPDEVLRIINEHIAAPKP